MNKDFAFVFYPVGDISAYELAILWAAVGVQIKKDVYEGMPPTLQRHFIDQDLLKAGPKKPNEVN